MIHSDNVFFKFLGERVFRFLSDGVFFRVLSDRVLLEASVIGSSSWSSSIDSSLGSNNRCSV